MRYAQIREFDVANGPGVRTTIFVTGCTLGCKNCFNKEYQDFNYGNIWTREQTNEIVKYLKSDIIEGMTILGGEPFDNSEDLVKIVSDIKKETKKNIWIFSGYVFEKLIKDKKNIELLKLCDVLVDGPFVEELKNLRLKFRGSENQRIIDLKKTFEENRIVKYME
ncbi:anaerobic ribonucleoside-triphosphate reductase activating protein [Miniphocaeibacter halophilus]|uniref:Anaerobic ribonucleoside-triphosphate reductase activating protein n=1 Tax=Miniphocaeibacter halophilus TaxID=2931922 RepID=A0AC61MPA3_9FIRM|nr:anaerobic ribonucleoside-triphosphate reductase activating protein [Miniphocaeibacter halophilus]QQK07344.1 anaerobic ribonucleoside-triphosphate reductase activating protein [Miniphocaeibacter halophilus]